MMKRFERQIRLFGKAGQQKLAATHVTVVGVGGLGTHVVQELALLGVGAIALIDSEELAFTDRNRYIGARYNDPIPGTLKVDIGERIIKEIDPAISVEKIADSLVSDQGFKAVTQADYVFGCLDCEGARLVLNELCAAYSLPYFDLASDIVPGQMPNYGGRICVALDGQGCLICYGLLDLKEAQLDLAGQHERWDRDALYGIESESLGRSGPSVVSLNGVVASLGVTEFMGMVTGIRPPRRLINYYGHLGKVTINTDVPQLDCFYCKTVRGLRDQANVERYVREGIGQWLR